MNHQYIDESYHAGSSDWYCRFCRRSIADINKNGPEECTMAQAILEKEKFKRDIAERNEYLRLKAERERFEELRRKYE
jgi:hypothetical protein